MDLIVFGEDWGRHPSSTQHLVRHIAREHRVIWINSLGLRAPKINLRDAKRVGAKLRSMVSRHKSGTGKVNNPESLSIVNPTALPFHGYTVNGWLNAQVVGHQIRREMARRGFRNPIVWTSLPTAVPIIQHLNIEKVMYYCGDDFSALEGVDHVTTVKHEKKLADLAKLIIAPSQHIAQRFDASKTLIIGHGVELSLFTRQTPRAPDFPLDSRPVVGFSGLLTNWLDYPLIAGVARKLPHWRFVFVGNVLVDISILKGLRNIEFLGKKDYEALPSYIQHWDVSIIPFRDSQQIRACNPLKLIEYLAAGPPVVSTDFPALAPHRSLIEICQTVDDFAAAIETALDDKERNAARQRSIRDQSWAARAADVLDSIHARMLQGSIAATGPSDSGLTGHRELDVQA